MKYECLVVDGRMVVAKPEGWKWSTREQPNVKIVDVSEQTDKLDFDVNIDGVTAKASEIDKSLIDSTAYSLDLELKAAIALLEANGYTVTAEAEK